LSLFVALLVLTSCALDSKRSAETQLVGRYGTNRFLTPSHQVLTPYGKFIELAKLRPQGLALSPDGKLLAVSGKTSEVIILDPKTGRILQHANLPSAELNEPEPDVVSPNILAPDKKRPIKRGN
jgi:hypothetical protein